jgi:protein-arginine kinase activator protein McsA
MLADPAFSLLAGFLAQTVSDARDMLADQLARQEFEGSARMTDRIES